MKNSTTSARHVVPTGCDLGHGFSSRACERGTNGCVVEHDAAKPPQSREQLEVLLRRSLVQLGQWQQKYGEHNPEWLPPAGDVRLAEDIEVALASTSHAGNVSETRGTPRNEELRNLWRSAGGIFYGESHARMSTRKLLPFLEELKNGAGYAPRPNAELVERAIEMAHNVSLLGSLRLLTREDFWLPGQDAALWKQVDASAIDIEAPYRSIRDAWHQAGGAVEGPTHEAGTMSEAKLLPFLKAWIGTGLNHHAPNEEFAARACVLASDVLTVSETLASRLVALANDAPKPDPEVTAAQSILARMVVEAGTLLRSSKLA